MELPKVFITHAQARVLRDMTRKGMHKAREITRAEILLFAHEGLSEDSIAQRVRRHVRTVRRVVTRFTSKGMNGALFDAPRSGQPRKTSAKDDAHLVAIACTKSPQGSEHWTLDLLTKRFKKDRKKQLGRTALWLRLSARGIKPWREKNVVHSEDHSRVHRAHGRSAHPVRTTV